MTLNQFTEDKLRLARSSSARTAIDYGAISLRCFSGAYYGVFATAACLALPKSVPLIIIALGASRVANLGQQDIHRASDSASLCRHLKVWPDPGDVPGTLRSIWYVAVVEPAGTVRDGGKLLDWPGATVRSTRISVADTAVKVTVSVRMREFPDVWRIGLNLTA